MSTKPNIIFILADQLRYQSCGYTGDPCAITPNIDILSEEGINLKNAVSSMPVCSAYRASLFTGKYTTTTGMVINELRINPNHRCLGHVLTDGGYNTAYIGKWHLWANELGNHYKSKNSYVPPGPYRLGFDGYWAAYNFRHEYTIESAYYHTDSPKKEYYPEYEPDAQTTMTIDYIKKIDKNNPFAIFLSFGTPHDPWEEDNVPSDYYNLFKNTEFPLTPSYTDELDPYGDEWSNIEKDPHTINEWKKVYYAMTTNLDHNVGRIMTALRELNLEEETIVVFTSDHGELFGAHGRMKKNIFYEEAIRVPFIVRWKGKIDGGYVSDICFNSVDIMPTLLGLVDLKIPLEVEGMDMSQQIFQHTGPEPEFALLQNTGACAMWENGHEWRGLRDKKYTYAIYRIDDTKHLYHNISDPYQLNNLAKNNNYTSLVNHYHKLLSDKLLSIGDSFEKSTWYRDHWINNGNIMIPKR